MRDDEDVDRLRQAEDPSEHRDLLAAEAERLTVAVPVLIQRSNRACGLLREAELFRDVGAELAPRPEDVRLGSARQPKPDERGGAREQPASLSRRA